MDKEPKFMPVLRTMTEHVDDCAAYRRGIEQHKVECRRCAPVRAEDVHLCGRSG